MTGRSRPYALRITSIPPAEAFAPPIEMARSPDSRVSANANTSTVIQTRTATSSRRIKKCRIATNYPDMDRSNKQALQPSPQAPVADDHLDRAAHEADQDSRR